jgi:RNA polymerase sigma-70 factor (ECF subfamily)
VQDRESSESSAIAAALARRIAAGDRSAESDMVRRFGPGLMFMLRHRCRDPERVRDLHQETFVVVIQRLRGSGIEQPELLARFIQRTAANLLIAEQRRESRRRTDTSMEAIAALVEPAPGPPELIDRAADARVVRQVIGELRTPRDREILYRYFVEDDDKEHICRDLELSPLHFNRVLFRAKQRFLDRLARRGESTKSQSPVPDTGG